MVASLAIQQSLGGNKANVLEMVLQIEGFSILCSFDCPPAGLCTCEFMLQNLVS